ncbi:hypothetical protein V1260_03205 [Brachybacterium sp. J144]|uniref:hypothetical protein n=1 Tax=Brachybacterium sp. J144 TaxID=3116487 RepID=UPI002E787067|nr:hypothetical protein [Brachybacterium sp. J144]MEE1649790.1 hypothetical protein [Brachybacterium sp. J144]
MHTSPLRRCTRLLAGAALVGGLAIAGAGAATADGADVERTAFSSAAQSDSDEYWTSARMEAAA